MIIGTIVKNTHILLSHFIFLLYFCSKIAIICEK